MPMPSLIANLPFTGFRFIVLKFEPTVTISSVTMLRSALQTTIRAPYRVPITNLRPSEDHSNGPILLTLIHGPLSLGSYTCICACSSPSLQMSKVKPPAHAKAPPSGLHAMPHVEPRLPSIRFNGLPVSTSQMVTSLGVEAPSFVTVAKEESLGFQAIGEVPGSERTSCLETGS